MSPFGVKGVYFEPQWVCDEQPGIAVNSVPSNSQETYMAQFHPDFVAARHPMAMLSTTTRQFGVNGTIEFLGHGGMGR